MSLNKRPDQCVVVLKSGALIHVSPECMIEEDKDNNTMMVAVEYKPDRQILRKWPKEQFFDVRYYNQGIQINE